jgi:hypothetical protein
LARKSILFLQNQIADPIQDLVKLFLADFPVFLNSRILFFTAPLFALFVKVGLQFNLGKNRAAIGRSVFYSITSIFSAASG